MHVLQASSPTPMLAAERCFGEEHVAVSEAAACPPTASVVLCATFSDSMYDLNLHSHNNICVFVLQSLLGHPSLKTSSFTEPYQFL